MRRRHMLTGLGSSVIIPAQVYILNTHAVAGAHEIQVSASDELNVEAKFIDTDPETDFAVLEALRGKVPALIVGSLKDLLLKGFAGMRGRSSDRLWV